MTRCYWYHEYRDMNMTIPFCEQLRINNPHCGTECSCKYYISKDDADKIIRNASAEPKWIPCSERLPEEEEKKYWVCTDAEYQCECRWTNTNHFWTHLTTDWHWHIMDIPKYTKVIAWMPLPEPYREDGEKE